MEQLKVLSDIEIELLYITEEEEKSNDAFSKLTNIIKYYNKGWKPSKEDYGYFIYLNEKLPLWGGHAFEGSSCSIGRAGSVHAFLYSLAFVGARLAIKDYNTARFILINYEHLYRELFIEE